MEHPGHLTGHQAAGGGVALKHGPAQAAEGVFFQFHLVGPGLFLPDVLAAHAVFQHTHRCADAAAGDDGVTVLGLEQGGFIVLMDGALLACQQAGAHLYAAGAQGQRSRQLAAALALGACGVQVGTCLLASEECPIHENYKAALLKAKDSDTIVTGRSVGAPVRVLKNRMSREYVRQEKAGADKMELEKYTLGSLRRAVFEGDTTTGSLMAGQVAGMLHEVRPVADILNDLWESGRQRIAALNELC